MSWPSGLLRGKFMRSTSSTMMRLTGESVGRLTTTFLLPVASQISTLMLSSAIPETPHSSDRLKREVVEIAMQSGFGDEPLTIALDHQLLDNFILFFLHRKKDNQQDQQIEENQSHDPA